MQHSTDPTTLLGLIVAHHDDRRHVGSRVIVADGQRLEVGRGSAVFGAGVLDDPRVSRRHAVIVRRGEQLLLVDNGSHNGVRVNASRVTTPTVLLHPGDVLQVGGAVMLLCRMRWTAPAPASPHVVAHGDAMGVVLRQLVARSYDDGPVALWGEPEVGALARAQEVLRMRRAGGRLAVVKCAATADEVDAALFGDPQRVYFGDEGGGGALEAADVGVVLLRDVQAIPAPVAERLNNWISDPMRGSSTRPAPRLVTAVSGSAWPEGPPGAPEARLWKLVGGRALRIPSLRERQEDVPAVALKMAERFAGGPGLNLGRRLAARLMRYPWPGNLAELEDVIRRLVQGAGASSTLDLEPWLVEIFDRADRRSGGVGLSAR
jgi:hypothetical protein